MIMAKSIGSPMGTVTHLQIGVPPNLYAEYKQLSVEVKEKKESLNKVDQSITFLISKSNGGKLDAQKRIMLSKLQSTRQPVVEEYETLVVRQKKLAEILGNAQEGMIKCTGNVYPGVKIAWGNLIKYIDDEYYNTVIRKQDGEIYIGM